MNHKIFKRVHFVGRVYEISGTSVISESKLKFIAYSVFFLFPLCTCMREEFLAQALTKAL